MPRRHRVTALLVVVCAVGAGATVRAALPLGTAARTGDAAVRLGRPGSVSGDVAVRAAQALADAVNVARSGRGLAPLRWDDAVARVAFAHAADLAASGALSHLGSDGRDGGLRLRAAGVSWTAWGEALGAGFRDVTSLVDAWWASPGHRAVLVGSFVRVGVGVATSADGTPYWVLVAVA